jgi:hypothetical protein
MAKELPADSRMNAIGADQDVAALSRAIGEDSGNAGGIGLETGAFTAGLHRSRISGERCIEEKALKSSAVQADGRGCRFLAQRREIHAPEWFAGGEVRSRPFDDRSDLESGRFQTEAAQCDHRIGPERQPSPDLGDMRGFFEQRDVDADPLQRDRGGEPADAAANDQRANGPLRRQRSARRSLLVTVIALGPQWVRPGLTRARSSGFEDRLCRHVLLPVKRT